MYKDLWGGFKRNVIGTRKEVYSSAIIHFNLIMMAKAHTFIFIISFRSCKKGMVNRKVNSLPVDRKTYSGVGNIKNTSILLCCMFLIHRISHLLKSVPYPM